MSIFYFTDINFKKVYTVLPALRANSCIAIDRLIIELLDFHIPFLFIPMQVSRSMARTC